MLTVYISIIPFLIIRRVEFHFSDTLVNNLKNKRYLNYYERKKYIKKIDEINKFIRTFEKVKKISKLDETYVPDNLADKKIKDFVETYKSSKLNRMNYSQYQIPVENKTNQIYQKNLLTVFEGANDELEEQMSFFKQPNEEKKISLKQPERVMIEKKDINKKSLDKLIHENKNLFYQ